MCNETPKLIFNSNTSIYSGLPCVLLRAYSFVFSILRSGIVDPGGVWPAGTLDFEVSGTDFEDCYVKTVLCNVT